MNQLGGRKTGSELLTVRGGASVPLDSGALLTLNWPMVLLIFGDKFVALKFSATFFKRVGQMISLGGVTGLLAKNHGYLWVANANSISVVRVATRSMIFKSLTGDCSFGVGSHGSSATERMVQIRQQFDRMNLKQEAINSTFWQRKEMSAGPC
jgi:hypothetical protein